MAPFIIFALPRSRTAWLSRLLSYGDWFCGHDELRHCRSLEDVKAWLSQPLTGTVETAAAPFWRLARKYSPEARALVVRRPVAEVVDSLKRVGFTDRAALAAAMSRLDRKLDQIAARWPGATEVSFAELGTEDGCRRVFEYCLGISFDAGWWSAWAPVNIQINMPALVRYVAAYAPALEKLRGQAGVAMRADLVRRPVREPEGVTIQQEDFDTFYRDSTRLFEQHMVATGQGVEDYRHKNLDMLRALDRLGALTVLTARCNGRMAGYLMAVQAPSLDSPDEVEAMQLPLFADPDFPGLGIKLQRAAAEALRAKGVDTLYQRAGVRGSGPKLGTLYRRMGAEEFGQLYRLNLTEA